MNKFTFKKLLLGAFIVSFGVGIFGKSQAFTTSEVIPPNIITFQSKNTLENGVNQGTFTYYNINDYSNFVSLILYSEDNFITATGRVLVIQH
jgi:hypothetical protein